MFSFSIFLFLTIYLVLPFAASFFACTWKLQILDIYSDIFEQFLNLLENDMGEGVQQVVQEEEGGVADRSITFEASCVSSKQRLHRLKGTS